MRLNTHPQDRKQMVTAISEQLGLPAVYLRMPTYAFQIGDVTVNRDGTVESENTELLEQISSMLMENGWLDAENSACTENTPVQSESAPAQDIVRSEPNEPEATMLHLHINEPDWTVESLCNMLRILHQRQRLFNRMLKLENGIRIDDKVLANIEEVAPSKVDELQALIADATAEGLINGIGFFGADVMAELFLTPEAAQDAGTLLVAIIRMAKTAKRVSPKVTEPGDNEKYMANAWLQRLGLAGAENKAMRHRLMNHLNGYAAFKDNARMEAHKERLAAKRHVAQEGECEND